MYRISSYLLEPTFQACGPQDSRAGPVRAARARRERHGQPFRRRERGPGRQRRPRAALRGERGGGPREPGGVYIYIYIVYINVYYVYIYIYMYIQCIIYIYTYVYIYI